MSSLIYPGIVSQHAEEAADLWSLRNGFVKRPEITLRELARLDERIEAHVDGLRIAGVAACEVCTEMLPGESAGEVFARFLWAFSTGDQAQIERVMAACEVLPNVGRGLASALGWLPFQAAEPYLRRLLEASSPLLRRVGLAASALHRQHPGRSTLRGALSSDDPQLHSRALRAVGEIGVLDELPFVLDSLDDRDSSQRFWAAWTTALLSWQSRAIEVLIAAVEGDAPLAETALAVLMRRMYPDQAQDFIRTLIRSGKQVRLSILALAMLGEPGMVPLLFEFMETDSLARLSGAAFRMITGQDLKRQYLDKPAPEVLQPLSSVEEEEDDAPDPDQDLPWPDLAKVKAKWSELNGQFIPGHRYLLGKDIAADPLRDVLLVGRQRERASAAAALAVRDPGRPLFNCSAPARRQYQALR